VPNATFAKTNSTVTVISHGRTFGNVSAMSKTLSYLKQDVVRKYRSYSSTPANKSVSISALCGFTHFAKWKTFSEEFGPLLCPCGLAAQSCTARLISPHLFAGMGLIGCGLEVSTTQNSFANRTVCKYLCTPIPSAKSVQDGKSVPTPGRFAKVVRTMVDMNSARRG
jgi:hypothetical protein